MALKHFLIIFLSFFTLASSQSISCLFQIVDNVYWCSATINNPGGSDEFSGITGVHLDGKTNNDVLYVRIVAGTTPIIPRAICDAFNYVERFEFFANVGIQRYTEHALSSCVRLHTIFFQYNPVTEIHPNFLRYNVNLFEVSFYGLHTTTIPEELFSTTTKIAYLYFNGHNYFSLFDLPANLFKSLTSMVHLSLDGNGLVIWRPEWTQSMPNLRNLFIHANYISVITRNAINSNNLRSLNLASNQIEVLDYFMFNNISSVTDIYFDFSPVEAVDFNLVDMATSLTVLLAYEWKCINNVRFYDFNVNREAYMAQLEPCFAAFDSRTLTFSTYGTVLTFNSIRKEFINLQVQAPSDAIIRFSSNPDGSGSNFEVKLGIDGNMNSCIYENGVQRTCTATPGLLNYGQMTSFTIMWSSGSVYVMHGNPLMFYNLASPFKVRFYGVATNGPAAHWIIE